MGSDLETTSVVIIDCNMLDAKPLVDVHDNTGSPRRRKRATEHNPFFVFHSAFVASLCVVDIVLNSSIEYGDLPGQEATTSNNATILLIVQILLQIFAFVNFFALFGATFLFRSGLFNLLYRQFRPLLWIHPLYITATAILGVIRIRKVTHGASLLAVWDDSSYAFLSCAHKLGAVGYYFSSIDAVEKLRDPKFYSQDYWLYR